MVPPNPSNLQPSFKHASTFLSAVIVCRFLDPLFRTPTSREERLWQQTLARLRLCHNNPRFRFFLISQVPRKPTFACASHYSGCRCGRLIHSKIISINFLCSLFAQIRVRLLSLDVDSLGLLFSILYWSDFLWWMDPSITLPCSGFFFWSVGRAVRCPVVCVSAQLPTTERFAQVDAATARQRRRRGMLAVRRMRFTGLFLPANISPSFLARWKPIPVLTVGFSSTDCKSFTRSYAG